MLSDSIMSMLIVTIGGLVALSFKLCYNSKCKSVKCCCGEIQRDVEHETQITVDNNISPRI